MTSAVPETDAPATVPIDGRRLRREENARRLYDAATELFATGSFDELSVDDICEQAGVGRATFFRIYDTKAGLLREFNRRLTADARSRLAAAETDDVRARLDIVRQTIVDAWSAAGTGHIGMAVEALRAGSSSGMHALHPELFDLVTEIIADAVERDELAATVPVRLAASLAVVHLSSAVAYSLARDEVDIDELSRTLLDQWLRGMQP